MLALFVLVLGVFALLVARAFANGPAGAGRVEGFVRRYGLQVGDAGRAYIGEHLGRTRRYRWYGIIVAAAAIALYGVPHQHIEFAYDLLACGWLAGAWAAEAQLARRTTGRRVEREVPRWLIALPYTGAGISIVTGLLVRLIAPGHVMRWTLLAVLVLAVTVASVMLVEDRGGPEDLDERVADRAIRAHSVAALTAVGIAIAILFMMRGTLSTTHHAFGVLASAARGLGIIWSLGALVVAVAIARVGSWSMNRVGLSFKHPAVWLAAATTALVAATGGWVGWTAHRLHPPYPVAAVHPAATVKFTDEAHEHEDLTALGITDMNGPIGDADDQMLVGQIVFASPPVRASGDWTYFFVLIDKATNSVVTNLYDATGSGGWNGFLNLLPERYPWLEPVRPVQVGYESYADPMSVFTPVTAGTASFAALIPGRAGMDAKDLLIAMVFVGSDQQIYWATPVPITLA